MACHQENGLVVCGKQHPTLRALTRGKAEKKTDALRLVCTPPSEASASVPGERSQELIVTFQHPDRDAAAAQTAYDPEAAVVGSHDNRTHWLSRHCLPEPFCRDLSIRRKRAREVNSEPATKRIRGPKLHAAGAPMK